MPTFADLQIHFSQNNLNVMFTVHHELWLKPGSHSSLEKLKSIRAGSFFRLCSLRLTGVQPFEVKPLCPWNAFTSLPAKPAIPFWSNHTMPTLHLYSIPVFCIDDFVVAKCSTVICLQKAWVISDNVCNRSSFLCMVLCQTECSYLHVHLNNCWCADVEKCGVLFPASTTLFIGPLLT